MRSTKKSIKKPKKINPASLIKIISIILILSSAIFLFFAFSSTPSFKSDNPVLNHTVLYADNIFFTYEVNKYPTSVEISDIIERNLSIGFSLEPSTLNFGVVPTGGNMGKRFLTLKNTQDNKVKMQFIAYGNISPMIKFSDNDFYLMPDEVKQIDIMLETGQNTPAGDYFGEINLIVKRPKYDLLKWFS
ncbi:MAG: hypothetical protein KAJ54_02070 [Candidatus Aenigmarchaeota archaeon]|nr:hypothetical protein [Candidatus Aenigmarchaeota archaeon]